MATPYIGFGNETLDQCPPAKAGDVVTCHKCSGTHELTANYSDSGELFILTFKCGDWSYLAGINNKLTLNTKPDASGQI